MPIDPDVAIGADLGARTFSWTSSDVLLYHLGIGAGSRDGDHLSPAALRYTLDDEHLQVLPSFAVVAPTFHETDPPPLDLPGCDIDLAQVVHGSQSISLSGPVPTAGTATVRTRITDVWDKGRAAVIWQEGVATEGGAADGGPGRELWRVRSSIFVRGEGGWGGERGSSTAVTVPERGADYASSYRVTPQQALLYRLCGDRNPLHADPSFARAAGFDSPILHGLCSYGIVLRELADGLLGGDATAIGGFTARFAGIVLPGETIAVEGWHHDGATGKEIVARASVIDGPRSGSPVLADCRVTLA
ncbi:MaoC/PaaZ C-terminal domain-containing protein [Nocardioides sp.]|uniref:MaoC/PaaZ C-terminal domain-containing protein n=1 Tax=Nocardioides sp. TaxID=35761 RepID=UPI003510F4AE